MRVYAQCTCLLHPVDLGFRVVSHCVGPGNRTQVFCRNTTFSSSLSHVSSPQVKCLSLSVHSYKIRVSCSPSWPQTYYVAEDCLDVQIFLLSASKYWDYVYTTKPGLSYV